MYFGFSGSSMDFTNSGIGYGVTTIVIWFLTHQLQDKKNERK